MASVIDDSNKKLLTSIRFGTNEQSTIEHLRSKTPNLSQNCKGYKIPTTYLEEFTYDLVLYGNYLTYTPCLHLAFIKTTQKSVYLL